MTTILVVDDCDQNRILLGDLLGMHGYAVLLARDGAEGVAMAVEHRPALILMDIQMPVMNGLEAGRALRSDPRTQAIGLFALSSYTLLDDKDDFFRTGFDGHLDKPLDIRKLPEIIKRYLSERGNG